MAMIICMHGRSKFPTPSISTGRRFKSSGCKEDEPWTESSRSDGLMPSEGTTLTSQHTSQPASRTHCQMSTIDGVSMNLCAHHSQSGNDYRSAR